MPNPKPPVTDEVRILGNFAAHPIKSHTGEVLVVEPGEAEGNLEALDVVFDPYYIKPVRARERLERINQKVREAGRRELPQP